MAVIHFPTLDLLRWVITSGIVPTPVCLAPARVADGEPLGIVPSMPLVESTVATLRSLGAIVEDGVVGGRPIAHWLEALPLERTALEPITEQTPVLFQTPADGWTELAGEMLRLGNDRQSFRRLASPANEILLRVLGPQYFSLLRALDRSSPLSPAAYLEHGAGIWVEVGWAHPLGPMLRAPESQIILLRPPNTWAYVNAAPFHDIYDVLSLKAGAAAVAWTDAPLAEPIDIPLRLTAGNTSDRPELWLLADDGERTIDEFVRNTDRRTLDRLTFAVGETSVSKVAALKARPNSNGPPHIALSGAETFRPFEQVANLYLPCGAALSPPLSRELTRRLLADDPDQVTCLSPAGGGQFTTQRLPESEFRPLGDWPEHVIETNGDALVAWAAGSQCRFVEFVAREPFVAASSASRSTPIKPKARVAAPKPAAETKSPRPKPTRPRTTMPASEPIRSTPRTPTQLQIELTQTEDRFLNLDGPMDSPERRALWPRLAQLNSALEHGTEAALCWLHSLWLSPSAAERVAWHWVETERALPAQEFTESDLQRLMPPNPVAAADLRPLAAAIVWATQQAAPPRALSQRLAAVRYYLEQHDRLLPIRAVWLVSHVLTSHVDKDPLALARVRDRLLARLQTEGLSPERDLPSFLRFAGHHGGDRLRTVRERIDRLRGQIHRWSGFTSTDSLQQTPAYIDLMFGFAAARLGEATAARHLVASAAQWLDASGNEAHRFLLEAFRWRIEQVLAGRPHTGPLPAEQIEYLEDMRSESNAIKVNNPILTMRPYVIERMRKESRILEPQEQLDPYRHTKYGRDPDRLIRELTRLSDVRDNKELSDGLRRLVGDAMSRESTDIRFRILAEALPMAARIGAALCDELLDRAEPALKSLSPTTDPNLLERRALLLETLLFFAAQLDRSELTGAFVTRLADLVGESTSTSVLEAQSRLIGQSLRSLRKCGLREQTERLLVALTEAAERLRQNGNIAEMELVRVQLHIAGGWLAIDPANRAWPILDEARAIILSPAPLSDRKSAILVSLVCTYIGALAHAPLDEALDRVEELFGARRLSRLPNTFTTAPYYSRFHLNIVEAVVLALANEEFAMGPAARRWLDEDEYLVRRRIHADMRAALESAADR